MTKIFIATRVMDEHAITVECALTAKEHDTYRWHGADFPSLQSISCSINSNNDFLVNIKGPSLDLSNFNFDTIWYRRPTRPVVPTAWLHPSDVPAATKESEIFWLSFPYLFGCNAIWVNQWESRTRTNNKILQLLEAKGVGFQIPKSLFGNNVEDIKNFIRNTPCGVIYKTFFPMRWIDDMSVAKISTTPVDLNSLPSDRILQSVPSIFQERIQKKCEIRVTFMGDSYFAMEINSQIDPRGIEDFRRIPTDKLLTKSCVLPDAVIVKCRKLMRRFDILFCSFDFIVDLHGNYIFLEINEQGQFLWMEQLCPDLPILDAFTDFLVSPSRDFCYKRKSPAVNMGDIYRGGMYKQLYDEDNRIHVFSPDPGLAEPAKKFGVQVTL